MEKSPNVDETIQRVKTLSAKLENQALTLSAINRKRLLLEEQRKLVRRNFVKTSRNFSKVQIDLLSLVQSCELSEDQVEMVEEALKVLASATETLRSYSLISQKGN